MVGFAAGGKAHHPHLDERVAARGEETWRVTPLIKYDVYYSSEQKRI